MEEALKPESDHQISKEMDAVFYRVLNDPACTEEMRTLLFEKAGMSRTIAAFPGRKVGPATKKPNEEIEEDLWDNVPI